MNSTWRECGIYVNVALRVQCNYNCYYCIGGHINVQTVLYDFDAIERIYRDFGTFTLTELENGRGEASLHPEIIRLIRLVTASGVVRISSNNSSHPESWIPRERAERIQCSLSLHPEGESNMNRFLEHVKILKGMGCDVMVSYVAHPRRLNGLPRIVELFQQLGVTLDIQVFIGKYKDVEYPSGYTDDEFLLINRQRVKSWVKELYDTIPIRNFKGIPCLAGHNMLYINPDGQFQRCLYDKKPLEKLLDRVTPCHVDRCGCGYFLKDLNWFDAEFWNRWRSMAKESLLPDSGPEGTDVEQLIRHKKIKFLNLLTRYNKINFVDGKMHIVAL